MMPNFDLGHIKMRAIALAPFCSRSVGAKPPFPSLTALTQSNNQANKQPPRLTVFKKGRVGHIWEDIPASPLHTAPIRDPRKLPSGRDAASGWPADTNPSIILNGKEVED